MRLRIIVVLAVLIAWPLGLFAETTPREAQRFCVDFALLKGGVELRGTVLGRDEKELKFVVQRDWLLAHQPEMAKKLVNDSVTQEAAAREELLKRITLWQEERKDDTRLIAVLNKEQRRLAKPAPKVPEPASQFVVVTIPADRVRKVYSAPDESRLLAMVAWQQHLPKVEETAFGPLKTIVEQKVPDWQTTKVDLADRLPSGEPQTADEWAARQAIFEFEYRQRLDFQGTGNFIIRVGEGAEKPNLGEIFAKTGADLLQGELGGLGLEGLGIDLGPLLKPEKPTGSEKKPAKSDWQQTAIEEAKKLDCRGFRVTRVPKITGGGPATVTVSFFARLGDGNYRMIWSNETTTDPATIKDKDLERIQQDPQVQEILKVASALSIGQDATQAVRFGAAVQASLDESENRFFEFRKRYNSTLDGPTLVVPKE